MSEKIGSAEMYWYARGYYDGRAKGVESEGFLLHRYAYRAGYDKGVADYCEYDLDEDDDAIIEQGNALQDLFLEPLKTSEDKTP